MGGCEMPHRRKAGKNSRLRKGFRHDRPEYGDDARIPHHGCGDRHRYCSRKLCARVPEQHSIALPSMATHPRTTRSPCSPTANPVREKCPAHGSDYKKFCAALEKVCKSLALAIIADGEGAQRVIEIEVRGAPSDRAAHDVAYTIATSPLVKTALAGADPNWGRILAAAGRSGVKFNFERADIWLAGIPGLPPRPRASIRRTHRSRKNAREDRPNRRRSPFRQRPCAHVDMRFHRRVRPHQRQLPHVEISSPQTHPTKHLQTNQAQKHFVMVCRFRSRCVPKAALVDCEGQLQQDAA